MALTISTPYKNNTVASVSGTTFNSNGTPFVAGDVGRFIRLTSGSGAGQIRRINTYVDTDTVTLDSAWNVSPISAFTDTTPSSGDSWHMSYVLDDIDNGVDLIKRSAEAYEQISSGSITITLTNCFVACIGQSLILDADDFKISSDACLMMGRLHPSGYGENGGVLIDRSTGAAGGWSGTNLDGNSGDLHLYGVNIQSVATGNPFWRLYRSNSHVVRFVDCDFSGNTGGRYKGTKSCFIRCTYRNSTSGTSIGSMNPISPFGLIQDVKYQDMYQAIYINYGLGVGTISGPRFSDITGRLIYAPSSAVGGSYVIQDYIQSELEAAPEVANFQATNAGNFVDFKQYVTTSIVDTSLVPITDTSRRVIRNGSSTIVENVTTTSGSFDQYSAIVKRLPVVAGSHTWSSGSATYYGPYEESVATYLYNPQLLSLPLQESSDITFTMIPDTYITQTTKATVDAYTEISDLDRLYDRYKSWFVDNLDVVYPTFGVQKLNGQGTVLDCGSANIVVDATAGSAFAVNTGTNTITIKASTLTVGSTFSTLTTTGTVTKANGALISCIYSDTNGTYNSIAITGLIAGSRVRVNNDTDNIELYNAVVAGTSVTIPSFWTTDKTLDLRVTNVIGTTAYLPFQSAGSLTVNGASFLVSQSLDTVYNTNAINGSTVTEFTADYPNVQIDIDDGDSSTSVQRLYAWFENAMNSEQGIVTYFNGITAQDTINYQINTNIVNLEFDNVSATSLPIKITGAYIFRDDGTTVIYSGSKSIQMDPSRAYQVGVMGLTTAEHTKLFSLENSTGGGGFSSQALQTSIGNAKREILEKIETDIEKTRVITNDLNNEIKSHIDLAKTDIIGTIEGIEIPETKLEEKEAKKTLKLLTTLDKKVSSYIDSEMSDKEELGAIAKQFTKLEMEDAKREKEKEMEHKKMMEEKEKMEKEEDDKLLSEIKSEFDKQDEQEKEEKRQELERELEEAKKEVTEIEKELKTL